MTKILVPVDFSKASLAAVSFAVKWSEVLEQAEIMLLHVVYEPVPPPSGTFSDITNTLRKQAAIEMKKITGAFPHRKEIKWQILESHSVNKIISNFADKTGVGIIIIGINNAGVLKKIIGSTATAILRETSKPILIVPENVNYRPLKNILYASDIMHLRTECEKVISILRPANAFIHVISSANGNDQVSEAIKKDILGMIDSVSYEKIDFEILEGKGFLKAIDDAIKKYDAELLVMFNHHRTFFDRLFEPDLTKRMSFHTHISLLILS